MKVPASLVGVIIGRGGETIRALQEKSGAKIEVAREGEGNLGNKNVIVSLVAIKKSRESNNWVFNLWRRNKNVLNIIAYFWRMLAVFCGLGEVFFV